MKNRLTETLKKYWGYDRFRPLQEEIINSVLQGNDTIGLLPTGGGKSITFQVPGILLEGVTLVITPLISLMKDQVDNLNNRGIRSVFFHAGMTGREIGIAWEKIYNAKVKFIYISPERLSNERFCQDIKSVKISLLVIDEAHCISQWGYDFRPSYLKINKIRRLLEKVPVLALTATATSVTIRDICDKLDLKLPNIYKKSFSRPNIQYVVRQSNEKYNQILHILQSVNGSSIVYVRNRKRTREISEFLLSGGISAVSYHAGLSFEEKDERQNRWKKGEIRVIVATNAFGMGIDKPDVRLVIHYDIPPSIEEYYQEAGRAGRDGLRSYAVVLYNNRDKALLRRKLSESFPDKKIILKIYELVNVFLNVSIGEGYNKIYEFNLDKFCEVFNFSRQHVVSALKILTYSKYIEYIEETEIRSRIMIIADREELYHTHHSAQTDSVLQIILRLYTGLFSDYVFINESNIALKAGLSENQVYESLLELTNSHLIHYIPKKRTPYVYYPTSREDTKYIIIPKSAYEERKELLQYKIESIIEYIYSEDVCRVNYILNYFGEETTENCSTCDVCLKNRKQSLAPDIKEQLCANILDCVKDSKYGISLKQIEKKFHSHRKIVFEIISFLCDEEYITLKDGILEIKKD